MHPNSFVFSEYDVLKKAILCQPQYMTIREVINETQEHFKNEGIHIERALEQHSALVHVLRENGVEVILLPYHKKYPEQVFTRDIGFTLGRQFSLPKWQARSVREKRMYSNNGWRMRVYLITTCWGTR